MKSLLCKAIFAITFNKVCLGWCTDCTKKCSKIKKVTKKVLKNKKTK
jgi:hypothetical protein